MVLLFVSDLRDFRVIRVIRQPPPACASLARTPGLRPLVASARGGTRKQRALRKVRRWVGWPPSGPARLDSDSRLFISTSARPEHENNRQPTSPPPPPHCHVFLAAGGDSRRPQDTATRVRAHTRAAGRVLGCALEARGLHGAACASLRARSSRPPWRGFASGVRRRAAREGDEDDEVASSPHPRRGSAFDVLPQGMEERC